MPVVLMLLSTLLLPAIPSPRSPAAGEDEAIHLIYSITVVYENHGDEAWSLSEFDVAVGLFLKTPWQSVELVWTNWPVNYVLEDEDGNEWAILAVPDTELEPGEALNISARYEITSLPREPPSISTGASGSLSDIPEELKEEFTGPGPCWFTEDEELRELALNLSSGKTNVLEIIASFVEWINENVEYQSFEVPLYPNETYKGGLGDCDDQANLFITLCRIIGIPAYLQIGCIYLPWALYSSQSLWENHVFVEVRRVGWHGWATAYVPPWGWLPVDLTTAGVEVDPLNAIREAAFWHQYTILAMNIRESDYVGETRAARAFIIENDIYIYEEEELKLMAGASTEEPDMTMAYVLIISVCVTTAVCLIGIAFFLTRQKAPYQPA